LLFAPDQNLALQPQQLQEKLHFHWQRCPALEVLPGVLMVVVATVVVQLHRQHRRRQSLSRPLSRCGHSRATSGGSPP